MQTLVLVLAVMLVVSVALNAHAARSTRQWRKAFNELGDALASVNEENRLLRRGKFSEYANEAIAAVRAARSAGLDRYAGL